MSNRDNTRGRFEFIDKAPIFAGISLLLVIGSLVLIMTKGLNYGIDFVGGIEMQVKFQQNVLSTDLRDILDNEVKLKNSSVQSFGDAHEFLIRAESVQGANQEETAKLVEETVNKITQGLQAKYPNMELRKVDSVGPQVGDELRTNSLLAVFYALILILIYVGFRFDYKFAPGAVICLFHDTVVTLGIFSLLGKEVNVQTLAAVLTIIGYSLNDTIINFDRVRENLPLFKEKPFSWVVNRSVNDVLSRTILTSLTTLIAVLCLYFLGTGVIKDLAFALAIGIVAGTYSTIYVASPLTIVFDKLISAKN